MVSKPVLVTTDEWEGLYVDGTCVCQNHRLSSEEIITALFGEIVQLTDKQDALLTRNGYLPDSLEEFRKKYQNA